MNDVVGYLIKVISTTFSQIFILLGPGIILAFLMNFISDWARNLSGKVLGYQFFIYFTAIGTIVHELGHAFFAIIFGHHITNLKLFSPDELTGTLGYVEHRYNPENLYQNIGNFFIGIGPIISGSLVIFVSAIFTIGNDIFLPLGQIQISSQTFSSFMTAWTYTQNVFIQAFQVIGLLLKIDNLGNIWFIVFIYIVFAVGMHMKLSLPDLKSAWSGFVVLIAFFLIFNLFTIWIGDFSIKFIVLISQSYSFFYAYMVFAILLILFFLVILFVINLFKSMIRRY